MSITSSRRSSLALTLAIGVAAALLSTPSHAYTDEQQQACTPDAFRLCSSEIPDVDRITACMIRNRELLSPPCKAFFREPEPEQQAVRPVSKRKPWRPHRVKRVRPAAE